MTLLDIANLINSFGVSWGYDHFSEVPSPPYIVYYFPSENDIFADDSNYVNKRSLFIELYVSNIDRTLEATIENEMRSSGLTWYKATDWLEDEKLFQITYESEVIING